MRSENRPRRGRSFIEEARRAQIIACAIEVIAELGYGQTSLARIAERAGISKGVISYHFAGKDELIAELAKQVVVDAEAGMRPAIEALPDADGKLCAFIETNLDFMGSHRSKLVALVEIQANARNVGAAPLPDMVGEQSAIAGLERILRLGQRTGQFRAFSTRVMAVSIRAALDAVSAQLVADPDLDLRGYAKELIALFRAATRAEQAAPQRRAAGRGSR
ncbi:MAG: helix-turn-helix domain-containing protein [Actinocatenispora sp.]